MKGVLLKNPQNKGPSLRAAGLTIFCLAIQALAIQSSLGQAVSILTTTAESSLRDALVHADVTPGNTGGIAWFEWGTSGFTQKTVPTILPETTNSIALNEVLQGLQPYTTYSVRLVASNAFFGQVVGDARTFVTAPRFVPSSAPTTGWTSIACSSNGVNVIASGYTQGAGSPIYVSKDSGLSWEVTTAPLASWTTVACSVTGERIFAAGSGAGNPMYGSDDYGMSWHPLGPGPSSVNSIACSADGSKVIVCWDFVYISTNSGATFTATSLPVGVWTSVTMTADGQKMAASWLKQAPRPQERILKTYVSVDGGVTWGGGTWNVGVSLSCSADGNLLLGSTPNPYIFQEGLVISKDWGLTGRRDLVSVDAPWFAACSYDGALIAAVSRNPAVINHSGDGGITWAKSWGGVSPSSAAMSANGKTIYVADGVGPISIWHDGQAPLSISKQDSSATISWPSYSFNSKLEQSSDLTLGDWILVPETANLANRLFQVEIPASAGKMFYRLNGN